MVTLKNRFLITLEHVYSHSLYTIRLRSSCNHLIVVHEMHGRMHPNKGCNKLVSCCFPLIIELLSTKPHPSLGLELAFEILVGQWLTNCHATSTNTNCLPLCGSCGENETTVILQCKQCSYTGILCKHCYRFSSSGC